MAPRILAETDLRPAVLRAADEGASRRAGVVDCATLRAATDSAAASRAADSAAARSSAAVRCASAACCAAC